MFVLLYAIGQDDNVIIINTSLMTRKSFERLPLKLTNNILDTPMMKPKLYGVIGVSNTNIVIESCTFKYNYYNYYGVIYAYAGTVIDTDSLY